MKTTRTSCFETNSSSTHAYTLDIPDLANRKPAYKFVDEELTFNLAISDYLEGTPLSKLRFILSLAHLAGCQAEFDRVIETFADEGIKITCTTTRRVPGKSCCETVETAEVEQYEDEDERNVALEDELYKFTYNDDATIEEILEDMSRVYLTKENIKKFVLSDVNPFDSYTYYDG
jgi:hypothetical protein